MIPSLTAEELQISLAEHLGSRASALLERGLKQEGSLALAEARGAQVQVLRRAAQAIAGEREPGIG